MAEKIARLDKEQWDTLKAVLDGEIADLQRQLRRAQEKLRERAEERERLRKALHEINQKQAYPSPFYKWVKEVAHDALAGEKEDTMPSEDIVEDGWLKGLPLNVLVSVWIKAQPEMMAGIREGVAAAKAGKVTPWEEVERELGLGADKANR